MDSACLTPLGDLVAIVMGQAPPGSASNFDGHGTPFVKAGEFGESRPVIREWTTQPLKFAKRGDVLLCVVGATCGKINLGDDCAIGRSVAAIRPDPERLDQFYLHYFLMTLVESLRAGSTGAAQTVISKEMIQALPLPWRPLPEQRRIVAILDEAFEAIATAKANTEKNVLNAREWTDRQLATVLSDASANGLTDTLERVVASSCTLSYGIVQPGDDVPGGLPVVRPVDLGEKTVYADGLKRIDPVMARSYARTTLEGNDLLLCVRGTTGTVAIAEPALAGANVTRGIVPIRFDPSIITQTLGYYLLRSEPVQEQIRAKTYGTALMQINIGDLRKIVVAFPPTEKQAEVVEQLDAIQVAGEQLIDLYGRKISALDEIKKSLMHQAFSGQLTAKSTDQQVAEVA